MEDPAVTRTHIREEPKRSDAADTLPKGHGRCEWEHRHGELRKNLTFSRTWGNPASPFVSNRGK
jgi:hypothetical protein